MREVASSNWSNESLRVVPLAWIAGLALAMPVAADDTTVATTTETVQSGESDSRLSAIERERAAAWALTETEWRRYRELMRGIRGSVSAATLSPIEVLGIHARDVAERERYAKRWAVAMRADAERVLAFQQAYDAAAERLFRGQPLIDAGRLNALPEPTSALQPGDRVLFFTSTDCPSCEAMLVKLKTTLTTVAGIDIYFTNLPTTATAEIRTWASAKGIEPQWVEHRRVTLNFDNGLLTSLDTDTTPPVLFVRRDGVIRPLSFAEL